MLYVALCLSGILGDSCKRLTSNGVLQVFRPPRLGDRSVPNLLARMVPGFSSSLDHLIVVPGHAIWIGNDLERAAANDQWVLQENQKQGSTKTFIKHITKGFAFWSS